MGYCLFGIPLSLFMRFKDNVKVSHDFLHCTVSRYMFRIWNYVLGLIYHTCSNWIFIGRNVQIELVTCFCLFVTFSLFFLTIKKKKFQRVS